MRVEKVTIAGEWVGQEHKGHFSSPLVYHQEPRIACIFGQSEYMIMTYLFFR
jgi:hypothetical protein